MQPTKEDLVLLGKMKQEDLNYEIANYDYDCGLTSIDRDYAKRHGLTFDEMRSFKEDMIIEEEISRLNLEMTEKYDTKPHFAW